MSIFGSGQLPNTKRSLKKGKINKNGRRVDSAGWLYRNISRCERRTPFASMQRISPQFFIPPNREIKFTKCHKLNFVFLCCQRKTCVFIILYLPNAHLVENNTIPSGICFFFVPFLWYFLYFFIRSESDQIFVSRKFSAAKQKNAPAIGAFRSWCCDSRNRRTLAAVWVQPDAEINFRCCFHCFRSPRNAQQAKMCFANKWSCLRLRLGDVRQFASLCRLLFLAESCWAFGQIMITS